jgi:hypothetical protein
MRVEPTKRDSLIHLVLPSSLRSDQKVLVRRFLRDEARSPSGEARISGEEARQRALGAKHGDVWLSLVRTKIWSTKNQVNEAGVRTKIWSTAEVAHLSRFVGSTFWSEQSEG